MHIAYNKMMASCLQMRIKTWLGEISFLETVE